MTETTIPALPAEPPVGSVVRDQDGDVWFHRDDDGWLMASYTVQDDATPWVQVLNYRPLTVLIDGPVIS